MYQQKLSEKETLCIKLQNELKMQQKHADKQEHELQMIKNKQKSINDLQQTSSLNKSFDISNKIANIDLDELLNNSIDLISQRYQKRDQSREKSPVPKLNFSSVKEFQDQDWFGYSQKLQESIKVLNERIHVLEDENNILTTKYHKTANQNTKLYELNEKLNQALKQAKIKIQEIKNKFKEKLSKPRECSFCNNMIEMSMSNFTMTYDKLNLSFDTGLNNSFNNVPNARQPTNHSQPPENKQVFNNQGFHDLINDINSNEEQSFSREMHSGKPKIPKENSKYVKRKTHKQQNAADSGREVTGNNQKQKNFSNINMPLNIIHQVQGLSQILNPAQTFNLDEKMQNTHQTPTFQPNAQKEQLRFPNQYIKPYEKNLKSQIIEQQEDQEIQDSDRNLKKRQKQQLQEQFKKLYVVPQSTKSEKNQIDKIKQGNESSKNSTHDLKIGIQQNQPMQGQQPMRSQQNSKDRQSRLQMPAASEEIVKIKKITKKYSQTNRNSPSNQEAQKNNIISNIINVFERRKRN